MWFQCRKDNGNSEEIYASCYRRRDLEGYRTISISTFLFYLHLNFFVDVLFLLAKLTQEKSVEKEGSNKKKELVKTWKGFQ